MFFTKKQKIKLENEIQQLRQRMSDLDYMVHALAENQGLVIQREYLRSPFKVVKKEDAKPQGLTGAATTNFKL